jgi:hypothetical protein
VYLDEASQGWFSTYVFKIAYLSPIDFQRIASTLKEDLFGSMVGLTVLLIIAGVILIRHRGGKSLLLEPWNWFIGAALFISIAGRSSVGGNRNNLMPAYTFLCIAPSLAARETRLWRNRWQGAARNGLFTLIILQFGLTSLVPKYSLGFVPTSSMKHEGDRLIQQIAMLHGPVLVLMHPYYALLAGKEPGVDIQMLWHARLRGEEPLPGDFVKKIQNHYYSAIVSDESSFETESELYRLIAAYYKQAEALNSNEAPPTMTGVIVRPKLIYLPKEH